MSYHFLNIVVGFKLWMPLINLIWNWAFFCRTPMKRFQPLLVSFSRTVQEERRALAEWQVTIASRRNLWSVGKSGLKLPENHLNQLLLPMLLSYLSLSFWAHQQAQRLQICWQKLYDVTQSMIYSQPSTISDRKGSWYAHSVHWYETYLLSYWICMEIHDLTN